MSIRELLLNGRSFREILREFSIDNADFTIRDEAALFSPKDYLTKEILKERIFIQGKTKDEIVNFFGTIHCNLLNKLAVFELDGVERTNVA
ncbi:MAG TPA: hypothetical protein VGD92_03115 [Sphingobacteriaceae bacterium]